MVAHKNAHKPAPDDGVGMPVGRVRWLTSDKEVGYEPGGTAVGGPLLHRRYRRKSVDQVVVGFIETPRRVAAGVDQKKAGAFSGRRTRRF